MRITHSAISLLSYFPLDTLIEKTEVSNILGEPVYK